MPAAGFRARDDATYYPVPWLLSSRGVGVLVDNDETSYFRLGADHPERWSLEVTGAPEGLPPSPPPAALRLRVFAGPRPADALRRFTAWTGRQPEPDAPWVMVTLDDRRDRLTLLGFPRGRSEAAFHRRERLRLLERPGRWELSIRGARRRTYDVAASLATLASPFVPCTVEWNGRRLDAERWRWDADTRVLRVRVAGLRGRLVVQEGCR